MQLLGYDHILNGQYRRGHQFWIAKPVLIAAPYAVVILQYSPRPGIALVFCWPTHLRRQNTTVQASSFRHHVPNQPFFAS